MSLLAVTLVTARGNMWNDNVYSKMYVFPNIVHSHVVELHFVVVPSILANFLGKNEYRREAFKVV